MSATQKSPSQAKKTPTKKSTKPSKNHIKNKKHQKHRNQGEKHFGLTGQSAFKPTFSRFIKRADAEDQEEVPEENEEQQEQYRRYAKRPLESNAYKYEDAGESDGEEVDTDFNVFKDEKSRSLHILLEDFGGASSYHRKPWEKEWDRTDLPATDFSILAIDPSELAQNLKLLSVQQRLNLFSTTDAQILDAIMKVESHSSDVLSTGDLGEDSDEVIISTLPLALNCTEEQSFEISTLAAQPVTSEEVVVSTETEDAISDQEDLQEEEEEENVEDDTQDELESIIEPSSVQRRDESVQPTITRSGPHHIPVRVSEQQDNNELSLLDELMNSSRVASPVQNVSPQPEIVQASKSTISSGNLSFTKSATSTTTATKDKKPDDNLDDWLDSLI